MERARGHSYLSKWPIQVDESERATAERFDCHAKKSADTLKPFKVGPTSKTEWVKAERRRAPGPENGKLTELALCRQSQLGRINGAALDWFDRLGEKTKWLLLFASQLQIALTRADHRHDEPEHWKHLYSPLNTAPSRHTTQTSTLGQWNTQWQWPIIELFRLGQSHLPNSSTGTKLCH